MKQDEELRKMDRIERVISHRDFRIYMEKIEKHEAKRIFCKHDKKHFLDVCRISYLLYLEEDEIQRILPYGRKEVKEFLYAAGLLHDIGRWKEYEDGIPHEVASAELAKVILSDSGFEEKEIEVILELILSHRTNNLEQLHGLNRIFCQADKLSRDCFWCIAKEECNWKKEKKNRSVRL